MPDEEKKEEAPANTLAKAADRIRASAQYLLGAFAAVGATLAAGLQLGDIGEVSTDDMARLLATVLGIVVAVLGLAFAIQATADVSTQSHVDLPWLIRNEQSDAATMVEADVALRQGMSLPEIRDGLNTGLPAAATTYKAILELGNPGDDKDKQATARRLAAEYAEQTKTNEHLLQIRADVLDVASFHRIRSAYDAAKRRIVAGAVLAALGITAFAWGSNAPDKVTIDPGEIVPKRPSEVSVILTTEGRDRFQNILGGTCDLSNVAGIVFEVTNTTYEVVTERTDDCRSITLTVTPELGQVVPRIKSEAGGEEDKPAGS